MSAKRTTAPNSVDAADEAASASAETRQAPQASPVMDPAAFMDAFRPMLTETIMAVVDSRMSELAERSAMDGLSARDREDDRNGRPRQYDDTRLMERPAMDAYSPPSQLEVPEDDEYHYRWVAEYVNGSHMPNNVMKRVREGYERVKKDQLPEEFIVDEDGREDGFARNSGLLLMRVPKSRVRAREAYYRRRSSEGLRDADKLQGLSGLRSVSEDRGTTSLDGAAAHMALTQMSQ